MIILYENINEENNADTLDSKQSGKENCNLMSFEEFKNNIIWQKLWQRSSNGKHNKNNDSNSICRKQ